MWCMICWGDIMPRKGYRQTKESIRKRVSTRKKNGYMHSETTKQKMRVANFGKKLTKEHKHKLSIAHKGNTHTEESKRKISEGNLGKRRTEETKRKLRNRIITKETRNKLRKVMIGKHPTKETIRKLSESHKGQIPWMKGKKHTSEAINKMRESHLNMSEETRQKIGDASKGNTFWLGKKHTPKSKNKMSKAQQGKKSTKETKQKMRESKLKYIQYQKNSGYPPIPAIGKNEIQILDNLEKQLGYKIKRQYRVIGYFLDGYCEELNLAIEIDEKHHARQKEKDIIRENNIKNELNCEFVRLDVARVEAL